MLVAAAIAFVLWAVALGVFALDGGSSAGLFHPIYFGYAILLIFGTPMRWIGAAAFALLYGGMFLMFLFVGFNTYEDVYNMAARYITIASAVVLAALYGWEIYKGKAEGGTPLARLPRPVLDPDVGDGRRRRRWIGFAA